MFLSAGGRGSRDPARVFGGGLALWRRYRPAAAMLLVVGDRPVLVYLTRASLAAPFPAAVPPVHPAGVGLAWRASPRRGRRGCSGRRPVPWGTLRRMLAAGRPGSAALRLPAGWSARARCRGGCRAGAGRPVRRRASSCWPSPGSGSPGQGRRYGTALFDGQPDYRSALVYWSRTTSSTATASRTTTTWRPGDVARSAAEYEYCPHRLLHATCSWSGRPRRPDTSAGGTAPTRSMPGDTARVWLVATSFAGPAGRVARCRAGRPRPGSATRSRPSPASGSSYWSVPRPNRRADRSEGAAAEVAARGAARPSPTRPEVRYRLTTGAGAARVLPTAARGCAGTAGWRPYSRVGPNDSVPGRLSTNTTASATCPPCSPSGYGTALTTVRQSAARPMWAADQPIRSPPPPAYILGSRCR